LNQAPGDRRQNGRRSRRQWWYALLILPFIGLLFPPLYAFEEPRLFGVPFFYWYQFLWLLLTAGLTAIVYRATR